MEQYRRGSASLLLIGGLINAAMSYPTVWYVLTAEHSGDTEWIAFGAYTFYYALFPLNCFWDARYRGDFMQTDWIYTMLSLTSKTTLWIQVESDRSDLRVYLLGVALPFIALVLGVRVHPKEAPTDAPAPAPLAALVAWRVMPRQ